MTGPRVSRFEAHEALQSAMDRADELGGPERVTAVADAMRMVLDELGVDLDVEVVMRSLMPKAMGMADHLMAGVLREPVGQRAFTAATWAAGAAEGLLLGLLLGAELDRARTS